MRKWSEASSNNSTELVPKICFSSLPETFEFAVRGRFGIAWASETAVPAKHFIWWSKLAQRPPLPAPRRTQDDVGGVGDILFGKSFLKHKIVYFLFPCNKNKNTGVYKYKYV